ncbi:Hypothetical_protein [Hexamita inflata]|uniref:Hypothetical_protein n=1 Tax=Hexamita inflata TaxID=28002 RepID=A0AA86NM73_9EUKA|nr:Hypothetical protein HINF_LOCUS10482 [Hexamita inflata]
MIQILQALQLVCEQNFTLDTVNQQCVCQKKRSANKLKCVNTCEELGEIIYDDYTCVQSAFNANDCLLLYNFGSLWDGNNGCKCDHDNGYAGRPNHFCEDCWRTGGIVWMPQGGVGCAACYNGARIGNTNTCQECGPSNLVANFQHTACISCTFKKGAGSKFEPYEYCNCDTANGFSGSGMMDNEQCTDCWRQGQIIGGWQGCTDKCDFQQAIQNGRCDSCPEGFVPSVDGRSCLRCNQIYGTGSIYRFGGCSCDEENGFSQYYYQECLDCLRNDLSDKQFCQYTCKAKEKWDSALQKCVCDSAAGFGGVRGACSCDLTKGYAGTDSCVNCWASAKMATASGCVDCPANEIITPGSKTQCGCDSAQGYAGVSGSCSCSAPGFALTLGACVNCAQNGQIVSASGCVACPSSEKFDPSAKACVCDSTLGFVGVSGSCFCNFGAGLSQTVTGSVKSCGCNQQAGSVLDGAAPSLSCKCDASTGHAGQPGACFCDSSTGHFGYPGFCMCNFNLQFVGSAGSCKNCAALNAHASQFNGAYFCRCNGDSGYGSPDASGTCRICASGNSVVQVDSQGQFQCVACAATEKVVDNICVCAIIRQLRYSMD